MGGQKVAFSGKWLEEYSSEFNSNFQQLNLLEVEDDNDFKKFLSSRYEYTSPEIQNEINHVKYEFAKLSAFRAQVPYVPPCLCAFVP